MQEIKGCNLCGDFPVSLQAKCHPTAPLKIDMLDGNTLVLSCYLPTCSREVVRLSVVGEGMVAVLKETIQEAISELYRVSPSFAAPKLREVMAASPGAGERP